MQNPVLRRWGRFAPYILALASLLLFLWGARWLVQSPDAGASWSLVTGVVNRVAPQGPAAGRLWPGDRILAVDGLPLWQARLSPERRPGQLIHLLVERMGRTQPVVVTLAQPSWSELLSRLQPVLIGLIFWDLGVIVLAFSALGGEAFLFFLLCQISSAALVSGAASAFAPLWVSELFGLLLWWLVPLAVDFHFRFPLSAAQPRAGRLTVLVYLLAALGAFLDLASVSAGSSRGLLYLVRRFWLLGGLLGVVLLLARAYRRAVVLEARQQIGIVVLGGMLAIIPFLGLFLLPEALLHQPFLPYEISFLFLLAIPLAYGYAILHHRLIHLDRHVNRGATLLLVVMLLGTLYLMVNAALQQLIPPEIWQQPTVNFVLVMLLTMAFGPLHAYLQVAVSRLVYGGWYDYRSAVQQVSRRLDQVEDSATLAQVLSRAIQTTMRLECTCLLLPDDRKGGLVTSGLACQSCLVHQGEPLQLEMEGALSQCLRARGEVTEAQVLREALRGKALSEAEARLLACEHAWLWIPLRGRERSFGILVLGAKSGRDVFSADDLAILEVITRQAGIALQNVQLIHELRQQVQEVGRLHQEIIHAREAERKHVARELHDQVIQSLIGLNYRLSELRLRPEVDLQRESARLQQDVRRILDDVRHVCADLRPPTLDSLGLVPAIRSRLREVEAQDTLQVGLRVDGEEQNLPEEIALCLYRVLQEALLNVQRHAAARRVEVRVQFDSHEVRLSVEDDGQGFLVPSRLGALMNGGHFGLVGLRERLEMVNGALAIASTPGKGTRLEARVPLSQADGRASAAL